MGVMLASFRVAVYSFQNVLHRLLPRSWSIRNLLRGHVLFIEPGVWRWNARRPDTLATGPQAAPRPRHSNLVVRRDTYPPQGARERHSARAASGRRLRQRRH